MKYLNYHIPFDWSKRLSLSGLWFDLPLVWCVANFHYAPHARTWMFCVQLLIASLVFDPLIIFHVHLAINQQAAFANHSNTNTPSSSLGGGALSDNCKPTFLACSNTKSIWTLRRANAKRKRPLGLDSSVATVIHKGSNTCSTYIISDPIIVSKVPCSERKVSANIGPQISWWQTILEVVIVSSPHWFAQLRFIFLRVYSSVLVSPSVRIMSDDRDDDRDGLRCNKCVKIPHKPKPAPN